jgi:cytochrome c biogenesis protein CcmG/thiol:disulfide interchange protein DsbE
MTNQPDFLQENPDPKQKNSPGLSPGSIVLIVGVVVIVLVFAVQLFRQNQTQPLPGDDAPDFTMTTFDGQEVSLSDYEGRIVVLNFWGSWCGPCRAEAPDLQDIYTQYEGDVVVFGVNWLDIEDEALAFMEEFGITYPNAPDIGEKVASRYNIEGAPETFVINREGVIAETYLGMVDYSILNEAIQALLREDVSS